MPLRGEDAARAGITYDWLWAVDCMVEVLQGRADSVRPGPLTEEGVDVVLCCVGQPVEHHQVKRQRSGRGAWSLTDLGDVLKVFAQRLRGSGDVCVFVSMQDAPELRELSERARKAASSDKFADLVGTNRELVEDYATLKLKWASTTDTEAYEMLRRVRVDPIGEDVLARGVEARLSLLVAEDPRLAAESLFKLAAASTNRTLSCQDLWNHLAERQFTRNAWNRDPSVFAGLQGANDRYARSLQSTLLLKQLLGRPEVNKAVDMLGSSTAPRSITLVGKAGAGKSCVLLGVMEHLRDKSIPHLALRLDDAGSPNSPTELGQSLSLRGSPARVLAAVAQGKPAVLILDQLDAVRLTSGRNPHLLGCVRELLAEAMGHANIRLLLACRKYDLDHDHQLRQLTSIDAGNARIEVSDLDAETVKSVLRKLGTDPNALGKEQLSVLAVPLHLFLFEQARQNRDFKSTRDLYDQYWDYKQDAILREAGMQPEWTQVLDVLVDHMSTNETFAAPVALLDAHRSTMQAMLSHHVIIQVDHQIRFFHQSLLDYAFARRFTGRQRDLIEFLLDGEQTLFKRPLTREVLLQERRADHQRFLSSLRAILGAGQVRPLIQEAVFDMLVHLDDPKPTEWEALEQFFTNQDPLVVAGVWSLPGRSAGWFELVHGMGRVRNWLDSNDGTQRSHAVELVTGMVRLRPDLVAGLLKPYVGTTPEWHRHIASALAWVDLSVSRPLFDLYLSAVDTGILDGLEGGPSGTGGFWTQAMLLAEKRADLACIAIGRFLRRRLAMATARGVTNPFDQENGSIRDDLEPGHLFSMCAQQAPKEYLEQMFPFVLSVVESSVVKEGEPPWRDSAWAYHSAGMQLSISDCLLGAIPEAMGRIAETASNEFHGWVARLRGADSATLQYLLVTSYAAAGRHHADEAIDAVITDPRLLHVGYIEGSHWATRELLEATAPHCSDDRLRMLEAAIMDYYPAWEKRKEGHRYRGDAQMILLNAIPADRISSKARARLEEWRRKFRVQDFSRPRGIEFGCAGSPIPSKAAERMTDAQWLAAISKYPKEETKADVDGGVVGGALELARLIEERAKAEPARFAALMHRIPADANTTYFCHILSGMAKTSVDTEVILDVCELCDRLPGRPCGMEIADAIKALAERELPTKALGLGAWYATEDPDPSRERWSREKPADVAEGIMTAAINSVRGRAVEAVSALIWHDEARIESLRSTLDKIVSDRSVAVRSVAAGALVSVLRHERDLAVELFLKLIETDDILLCTGYVVRFLRYALHSHFVRLLPVLSRMLSSANPDVVAAGASEACIASLVQEAAQPLAENCLHGTPAQRLGAARVYAANLSNASYRGFCEDALKGLFSDSDSEAVAAASRCFHALKPDVMASYGDLASFFVTSPAFHEHHYELLRALEECTACMPELLYQTCRGFVNLVGDAAGDATQRAAAQSHTVAKLIVRAYSQTEDSDLRRRCLDVMDAMIRRGYHGIYSALQECERE